MDTNMKELNLPELEGVTGGKINSNPTPGNPGIDGIITGKYYDAIAQAIANWLNGDDQRTRWVNNRVDIYDCDI